ncbi:hypothetical protein BDQ12DRAFT_685207 [Crucibulum laeve]|uniref:Uncharacterized protein n=1 Tax=Crucibulum laeve TaxID=68775 RepID=A0A5C3LXS0_9AGAR|nr:hypothetical protein BDQ12DRAFT_685207 [Crucibulum laeve]
MVAQIGIAIYLIEDEAGNDPYFHWALAIAENLSGEVVQIYEIVEDDSHQNEYQIKAWKSHFTSEDVRISSDFTGMIFVGETEDFSIDDIDAFVREDCPAENLDSFAITGPGKLWSCSVWVMRALLLFESAGMIDLSCAKDELYLRVLERAEGLMVLRSKRGSFKGEFPVLPL